MDQLNSLLEQEEKLVTCVYNKAHTVTRFRLQKHLFKCRQAYSGNDIHICRFNVGHHVHEDDMKEHEKKCPDRVVVEKIMLASSAKRTHEEAEAEPEKRSPPKTEVVDDWDQSDEEHFVTPDDKKRKLERESTAIIHYQNMTKSQKRDARDKRYKNVVKMKERRSESTNEDWN